MSVKLYYIPRILFSSIFNQYQIYNYSIVFDEKKISIFLYSSENLQLIFLETYFLLLQINCKRETRETTIYWIRKLDTLHCFNTFLFFDIVKLSLPQVPSRSTIIY